MTKNCFCGRRYQTCFWKINKVLLGWGVFLGGCWFGLLGAFVCLWFCLFGVFCFFVYFCCEVSVLFHMSLKSLVKKKERISPSKFHKRVLAWRISVLVFFSFVVQFDIYYWILLNNFKSIWGFIFSFSVFVIKPVLFFFYFLLIIKAENTVRVSKLNVII